MLKTPKNKRDLTVLAVLLYLTFPFFEFNRIAAFMAGLSPAAREELTIFIVGGGIVAWVWGFIALGILLNWIGRGYPSSTSIFAFNRERMFWSFIWSSIFGYFFFNEMFFAIDRSLQFRFFEAFQGVGLAYTLLCVRTLILFKKE